MNIYLEKIAKTLDVFSKLKALKGIAKGRAHPHRITKPLESLKFESTLARHESKSRWKAGDRVGAIVKRVKSRDLNQTVANRRQYSEMAWRG